MEMLWNELSKKKPIYPDRYLCYIKNKGIVIRPYGPGLKSNEFRFWINGYVDLKVTHWMELPNRP